MLDRDGHVGRRTRRDGLRLERSAPTPADALRITAVRVAEGRVRVGSRLVHHAHLLRLVALVRVGVVETMVVGHIPGVARVEQMKNVSESKRSSHVWLYKERCAHLTDGARQ